MNENVTEPLIVSVGEFAARLKGVFRHVKAFARIGVSGEISELRPGAYGVAFTLKDANAVLRCFAFSKAAAAFPALENGVAITAIGSVEVQEKYGQYQLLVTEVRLTGKGELHQKYLALKQQFRDEGLFEPSRKKPVPVFPLHVTLISARQGKGAEDFARAMRENVPFVRVTSIETRVQGDGAEIDIAEAIDNAGRTGADLIVLARGGGSYEDLFPFNLEPVVRAIARARVPLMTAIGHTDDHHLADDVADLAFGTPSLAAEAIVKSWAAGRERLGRAVGKMTREIRAIGAQWLQRAQAASDGLERALPRFLDRRRALIAQADKMLVERSPQRRVGEMRRGFSSATARLDAGIGRVVDARTNEIARRAERLRTVRIVPEKKTLLERLGARLEVLSPEGPLERGYAIVTFKGEPLRDAANVGPGAEIAARLWRGSITARVEKTDA
ncbi:MAG TPA: exodeoxyribonuclease VII large subunit [Candidatus Baltobacteraceae bacterium]|jgi:exodeoxyribonuclease VII large subunit